MKASKVVKGVLWTLGGAYVSLLLVSDLYGHYVNGWPIFWQGIVWPMVFAALATRSIRRRRAA